MENKHNDRVIYLKDLLFSVVYRWKLLLAIAVICAILLGGFQFARNLKNAPAAEQPQGDSSAVQSEHEFFAQQKKALKAQIAEHRAFISNSLIMQLDPYNHYMLSLRYYIDTGYQIQPDKDYQTPDLADPLNDAYCAMLTGNAGISAVSEAVGVEPGYLHGTLNVPTTLNDHVLSFNFYTDSEESAKAAQAALEELIEQLQTQLNTTVGAHTLRQLESSISLHADSAIVNTQTTYRTQLTQLQTALTETNTQLNQLPAPLSVPETDRSSIKSAVVLGIVGALVGAFLTAAVLVLSHLCSAKLYSRRALADRTGIKCLGVMPVAGSQRKLSALEGRIQAKPEAQADLLAALIRNVSGKSGHILLTGPVAAEETALLAQSLRQAMPGVQISTVGNILTDASALHVLADCDAVVLTEQCGLSLYGDINRRAEMIADHGKQLLGCVVYGG